MGLDLSVSFRLDIDHRLQLTDVDNNTDLVSTYRSRSKSRQDHEI